MWISNDKNQRDLEEQDALPLINGETDAWIFYKPRFTNVLA